MYRERACRYYTGKISLYRFFLAKTLTDDARQELIQLNIYFDHRWVVLRKGRGRGLVLFWKSTVNLTIEGLHQYYFNATIDKDTENEWRLIGFYSKPKTNRRWEAWDKFRQLSSRLGIM